MLLPLLACHMGCADPTLLVRVPAAEIERVANNQIPSVRVEPLKLEQSPTLAQLTAYYCSRMVSDPHAQRACANVVGGAPPYEQLRFRFSLTLHIRNPNNFPVRILAVRFLFKLFPEQKEEAIGTRCVAMCADRNAPCTDAPAPPGTCVSEESEILHDVPIFGSAIPGLIAGLSDDSIAHGLHTPSAFGNEETPLTLSFVLGIDETLHALEWAIWESVSQLLLRGRPVLKIPVQSRGAVFFYMPARGGTRGATFKLLSAVFQIW
jgi:hypothetical protein